MEDGANQEDEEDRKYFYTKENVQWDCIEDMREHIKLQQCRHLFSKGYFDFYYLAFFFPTVVFAAVIPLLEAILEPDSRVRKILILVIGAINTVLIAYSNLRAFQSKRDRHMEASQQYEHLKLRLDARVIYPGKMCLPLDGPIERYLKEFQDIVDDLAKRCPVIPISIKESACGYMRSADEGSTHRGLLYWFCVCATRHKSKRRIGIESQGNSIAAVAKIREEERMQNRPWIKIVVDERVTPLGDPPAPPPPPPPPPLEDQ